jgi:hypothetical protein
MGLKDDRMKNIFSNCIMMSYYDSLSNYDKIYIYPSDLKNGNLGLINKLEMY